MKAINHQRKSVLWAQLIYEFCGTALIMYSYNLTDTPDPTVRGYAYFIGYIFAA